MNSTETEKGIETIPKERTHTYDNNYGFKAAIKDAESVEGLHKLVHVGSDDKQLVLDMQIVKVVHIHKPNLPTFRFTIKAATFKRVIDLLKAFVTDVRFKIVSDGIEILVVDPGHVVMLDMKISKDEMTLWEYDRDIEFAMELIDIPLMNGGDVTVFPQSIQTTTETETTNAVTDSLMECTVTYTQYYDQMVFVQDGIREIRGTVPLDTVTVPRIPSMDPRTLLIFDRSHLSAFLKRAEKIWDAFTIEALSADNHIRLSSIRDRSEVISDLTRDDGVEVMFTKAGDDGRMDTKSSYPVDNVHKFLKNIPGKGIITLKYGDDYPMIITTNMVKDLGSDDGSHIRVNYLQAPRL